MRTTLEVPVVVRLKEALPALASKLVEPSLDLARVIADKIFPLVFEGSVFFHPLFLFAEQSHVNSYSTARGV
jgi:hypothetical protein